jgi:hypothetical protein
MATSAKPTSASPKSIRSIMDGSSLHNPRCTWAAATAFALTRCRQAPEADLLNCEPQRPAVRHESMMDHSQRASSAHSGARRAAPGRTTARGSVGVARPASRSRRGRFPLHGLTVVELAEPRKDPGEDQREDSPSTHGGVSPGGCYQPCLPIASNSTTFFLTKRFPCIRMFVLPGRSLIAHPSEPSNSRKYFVAASANRA